jgi:hypothetical protein
MDPNRTDDTPADLTRRFTTSVTVDGQGSTYVPIPFDPDDAWGHKLRHHVAGELGGCELRGVLELAGEDGGHVLVLGPSWGRHAGLQDGAPVEVILEPEGPQRSDLAPDLAAALEASPEAGAFFDSLAQFYRVAYLRWIDATKRHPEQRQLRIAEVVGLLEEGKKERARR